MKILKELLQGSEEWFKWRNGKITGTASKTLVGYKEMLKAELLVIADEMGIETSGLKVDELKDAILDQNPDFNTRIMVKKANKDFEYKMLAYELSSGTAPDEDPRERGHILEPVIIEMFEKETGKKVEIVGGLERSDEPRIAISPDGIIKVLKVYAEAIEVKALAGWKHIKAWITNKIPSDHMEQALDYFVVNDDLQKLYFVMGCPEITIKPLLIFEINRKDYEKEIAMMLEGQREFWSRHDERVKEIYFNNV